MQNKCIKIDVLSDVFITKGVYRTVLEALLKYILYHCQQIPIQIDVLEKEIENWVKTSSTAVDKPNPRNEVTENIISDTSEETTNKRIYLRLKALQRREEQAKKSFDRRRQRWLLKVQTMIKIYRTTLDILKYEVENNEVNSTVFLIGPSPLTAKYVFRIHAPNDPGSWYFKRNSSTNSSLPPDIEMATFKRKILHSLLRSFASSEDLTTFTNSSFVPTKLWTLFEKEEEQFGFETKKESPPSGTAIIPRREFKIAPRAKIIEVFLREKEPALTNSVTEMILTPCVGVYDKSERDVALVSNKVNGGGAKACLFSGSNNIFNSNNNNDPCEEEKSSLGVRFLKDLNAAEMEIKDKESFLVPLPPIPCSSDTLPSLSPQKNCSSTPVFPKTPYHSADSEIMIETPVVSNTVSTPSPVKRLAQSITEFAFTPNNLIEKRHCTWYQIENSINGFKDVYLARNS